MKDIDVVHLSHRCAIVVAKWSRSPQSTCSKRHLHRLILFMKSISSREISPNSEIGLKNSFLRYRYLLRLIEQFPSETHYHLVLDPSIHFEVSHTVIYEDIRKMEFELSI